MFENKNIRTKDSSKIRITGVFNEKIFIKEVIKNKIIIELKIAMKLFLEK